MASWGNPGERPSRDHDDSTIVARLREPTSPHSEELAVSLREARLSPDDPTLAHAAARRLIAEGRTRADSRLVGGALALLRPFLDEGAPETLYLAATVHQYQHNFDGALQLLDEAALVAPEDVNIALTRATLFIVQGRLREALTLCQNVAALRPDVGFLCKATALMPTEHAMQVQGRLLEVLAQPEILAPELQNWARGLVGEIAMLQGDDILARTSFERVLENDPESLRERLLLADVLLRSGSASEVPSLLDQAPDSDGVLIRRIQAARALGADDTAETEMLAKMVRLNADLGLDAHAREDAMYYLHVADDPDAALERAEANWALQHEIEDAQLLLDAAAAAGRLDAARPALDWMRAEEIVVPSLRIPAGLEETLQ